MVALLDKDEGEAILQILQSIAKEYPQALIHPLRISGEQYQFDDSPEGKRRKTEIERFVKPGRGMFTVSRGRGHLTREISLHLTIFCTWYWPLNSVSFTCIVLPDRISVIFCARKGKQISNNCCLTGF